MSGTTHWARAITRLERANAALLGCVTTDIRALDAAMRERDAAVQSVARLDPEALSPPLLTRLRLGFEAGTAIRTKLSSVFHASNEELRRTKCVRTFLAHESTLRRNNASS